MQWEKEQNVGWSTTLNSAMSLCVKRKKAPSEGERSIISISRLTEVKNEWKSMWFNVDYVFTCANDATESNFAWEMIITAIFVFYSDRSLFLFTQLERNLVDSSVRRWNDALDQPFCRSSHSFATAISTGVDHRTVSQRPLLLILHPSTSTTRRFSR